MAAFSAFCRIHELDYNDDFKEYRGIVNAVSHYHYIYRGLQELAFATDKNLSSGYYLNEISKHINSFYEDTGNDYYSRTAEDPERVQTVIDEVEADFKVLLVRYLGLTNEDIVVDGLVATVGAEKEMTCGLLSLHKRCASLIASCSSLRAFS